MLSTASMIDQAIKEATADPYHGLPRAVVLAASRENPLLYAGKGGWAQLPPYSDKEQLEKEGVPITESSIFELYSSTKLVATIAALQLVEQGKMALEDDAAKYVPELAFVKRLVELDKAGKPVFENVEEKITIEMLVNHTAGFHYWFFSPSDAKYAAALGMAMVPNGAEATRDTVVKLPLIKPGERFAYGPNIDYLTLAVEEVSGLRLEEYLQRHIFGPLGISDMSFKANPEQISMATTGNPDPSALLTSPLTFAPNAPSSGGDDFGGAGLKSSPASYLKILRALLCGGELDGQRILKSETVNLMLRPSLTPAQRAGMDEFGALTDPFSRKAGKLHPATSFGYGGAIAGEGFPSGRGARALTWSGMANTFWVMDPDNDLAFVVWTNVLPFGYPPIYELWEKVETALYEGLAEARQ
ncbi:hypothetical protein JCM10213v2_001639 [Rhodosporidiobolus nylandii]